MKRRQTKTCLLAFGVMCVSVFGLTGCGFFSEKNSDVIKQEATTRPGPDQQGQSQPVFSSLKADQWLDLSRSYHQQGKYLEAIAAAQSALYLRPDYAEAYNNIGAAFASLHMWDPAIQAAQQALRIKPDFQLARNNLAWALEQKRLGVR